MKEKENKKREEKLEALKKVKDSKELEPIKTAIKDMEEVVQQIGAQMYQQQQQTAGAANPQDKKDPVEGDFEEVKEDKKKDK